MERSCGLKAFGCGRATRWRRGATTPSSKASGGVFLPLCYSSPEDGGFVYLGGVALKDGRSALAKRPLQRKPEESHPSRWLGWVTINPHLTLASWKCGSRAPSSVALFLGERPKPLSSDVQARGRSNCVTARWGGKQRKQPDRPHCEVRPTEVRVAIVVKATVGHPDSA